MRHHIKKRRLVVPAIVFAVCFALVAAMTMAQAFAATGKTLKCSEPSQAQQMCPPKTPTPTCETGTCKVTIDCPAIQNPGKTVCQATIDCPPKSAKPGKEQKKK
jgi:hypothetical protein